MWLFSEPPSMWLFRRKPPQADPKDELSALRKTLRGLLVPSGLEASRKFLPAPEVTTLVTTKTVRSVLPHDTPSKIIDFTCSHAAKLFLTLVVGGEADPAQLASVLRACQKQGMTDTLLPIEHMACIGRSTQCHSKHDDALNVFHHEIWADISFRFYPDQGMFHSPVFSHDQFIYELKEGCVLPITWKSPDENDGHFSTVYEALIHPFHHVPHEVGSE